MKTINETIGQMISDLIADYQLQPTDTILAVATAYRSRRYGSPNVKRIGSYAAAKLGLAEILAEQYNTDGELEAILEDAITHRTAAQEQSAAQEAKLEDLDTTSKEASI